MYNNNKHNSSFAYLGDIYAGSIHQLLEIDVYFNIRFFSIYHHVVCTFIHSSPRSTQNIVSMTVDEHMCCETNHRIKSGFGEPSAKYSFVKQNVDENWDSA